MAEIIGVRRIWRLSIGGGGAERAVEGAPRRHAPRRRERISWGIERWGREDASKRSSCRLWASACPFGNGTKKNENRPVEGLRLQLSRTEAVEPNYVF
jgi:hypothetical protein